MTPEQLDPYIQTYEHMHQAGIYHSPREARDSDWWQIGQWRHPDAHFFFHDYGVGCYLKRRCAEWVVTI
ncbi:hypothetical protein MesoLj131b_70710 (plasmid) [Mesorhizobium sp. 131-2-5]|nr:hypothetical protein MesoLj131b_70710 [Mesorhizobium sp. 131-2-5]